RPLWTDRGSLVLRTAAARRTQDLHQNAADVFRRVCRLHQMVGQARRERTRVAGSCLRAAREQLQPRSQEPARKGRHHSSAARPNCCRHLKKRTTYCCDHGRHRQAACDEVSDTWPTVKLGEVLRHRKEFITIDDLTSYRRPRVQLHVQGIVLRDEVPGALIKTKTQQVCRTGEFLVAEIDAKVGGFGIVPESLNGSIVSSHYFLFVIDETKLDRRFLDYFIRTPAFHEQVAAQGSTNYAAIRPAHVLGYEIPLPPLAEQWRVVARIDALAAQIHEARTLCYDAGEEVEAVLRSILTHDEQAKPTPMRE